MAATNLGSTGADDPARGHKPPHAESAPFAPGAVVVEYRFQL